jgi:hypothetical protein
MANEKVTLRFEEFDNDTDNTIISSGPVSIYSTVDTVGDLEVLTNGESFPTDQQVVVYVKNVYDTNYSDDLPVSQRARGAYFQYRTETASWQEILLGSHSHENKEFLDRIGDFDLTTSNMGKGMLVLEVDSPDNGLSYEYDVRFEELPEPLPLLPEGSDTTPLFLGVKNSGRAKTGLRANLVQSAKTVQLTEGTVSDLVIGQKIVQTSSTSSGGVFGEYASVETVDFLNNRFTTNVAHTTSGLVVFNIDIKRETQWSNKFVAPQTFLVRTENITESLTSVDFPDVTFNSNNDEVIVVDDGIFIVDPTLSYNSTSRVLTVTNNDGFNSGSKVTIIVLRNGAASILDEIATDYLTKAEAVSLLTGGTVNMADYATKQDLKLKANRYHSHSQFAKKDHDHDYRYASVNHTHSEYLTRKGALSLIEETLTLNPGIIDNLQELSDTLQTYTSENFLYQWNGQVWNPVNNVPTTEPVNPENGNLWLDGTTYKIYQNNAWVVISLPSIRPSNPSIGQFYYMSALEFLISTIPTNADLDEVTDSIDNINRLLDNMFTVTDVGYRTLHDRLISFLASPTTRFHGHQIDVIDARDLSTKDLQEVLDDLRADLDTDLGNLASSEVILDTDITVNLGSGNYVGEYDNGETVPQGRTLTKLITDVLQRRVAPTYISPEFTVEVSGNLYPEHGSTVQATFSIEFTQNDAGVLSQFNILANGASIYDTSSVNPGQPVSNSIEVTLDIPVLSAPVTVTVQAVYTDGIIKNNNFGEANPNGRIVAGTLTETFNLTPTDGILKGFSEDPLPSTNVGGYIRNNTTVHTAGNYDEFSHELVIPEGSRTIIFALPRNSNATVEKVLYKEQGNIDIIDLFTPSEQVSVDIYSGRSVNYDIYIYEMPVQTRSAMTLTFIR